MERTGEDMYIYPSAEKKAMDSEDDEAISANSEMRYISLELMKLAQKSGKTFEQVAAEYIANTSRLQEMIIGEEEAQTPQKKKGNSARENK
jgi:hypothetical protein